MIGQKILLFDFDGTLVDSLSIVEKIITKISSRYQLDLTETNLNVYRSLTASEIIKKIKLKPWLLPFFVLEIKIRMYFKRTELKLFPNVKKEVIELWKEGYELQILSSNSKTTIQDFLKRNNIERYFSKVHSSSKLFSKNVKINQIKQNSTNEILYIGDEVRDVKACNKAEIPILVVSWGYNAKVILEKTNCISVVDHPEDLKNRIDSYFFHKKE